MKSQLLGALLGFGLLCTPVLADPNSSLWGENGELWRADGRLLDYSYAGYRAGEKELPKVRVRADLKRDFGAIGDGVADDTEALRKAIRECPKGVLRIPAGIYRLTKPVKFSRSGLVLQGEGPELTVLDFPRSMSDVLGDSSAGKGASQWSFGPGFLQLRGHDPIDESTRISSVLSEASRGSDRLMVSDTKGISVGQWVRLVESDPRPGEPESGSLLSHLVGGRLPVGPEQPGAENIVRFLTRVKALEGNTVVLERPLPYDVRAVWKPELHRYQPTVEESGIENLAFRFPVTPYPKHLTERGYNGITFQDVANCWIKNVRMDNSDFAIQLNNTSFCTVTGVVLDASPERATEAGRGFTGHHGIDVAFGVDNLITEFDVRNRFVHDLSVEWFALGTVYSRGKGVDLNLDLHREFNYGSLFSDLDMGAGTRPFASGGAQVRGPHSGAFTTYWNLRSTNPFSAPSGDYGDKINFVGVPLKETPESPLSDWLLEQIGEQVEPVDLHTAMRKRRLSR